jgi:hypothetical protein
MGPMVNAITRPFYALRRDLVPIVREARWATGPVWTGAKNLDPGPSSPQRVAYIDYAVPAQRDLCESDLLHTGDVSSNP